MKITLLSLFISITSIAVYGQPVLNSDQYDLALGQTKKFDYIYQFDSSLTGANVVWDFSDLSPNFVFSSLVMDPASTEHGSNFPQANFALGSTLSDGRSFLSLATDGLFFHGSNNDNDLVTICSDNRQILNFPLTYESTFTDTWSCGFTFVGIPTLDEGNVTSKVDGYGTLILPYGTFSNVLRIRTFNEYVNSQVFNAGTFEQEIKQTTFTFISALTGYQLLSYSYLKPEDGIQETSGVIHLSEGTTALQEVNELGINVQLYPNPASDQLHIQVEKELMANILVLDVFGRTVISEKSVLLSEGSTPIAIQNLSSGTYFLNILSDDKRVARKFLKD